MTSSTSSSARTKTTRKSSSTGKPRKSLGERIDALTGRDEVAIESHFGYDIYDTWDTFMEALVAGSIRRKANTRLMRSLLFVERLHDGVTPDLAFDQVMDMELTEVNEALGLNEPDEDSGDDSGDGDDSDDETPAGKDEPGTD